MKTFCITLILLLAACTSRAQAVPPNIVKGNSNPTNSLIASGKACKLYGVYGQNLSGSTIYVQIFQTNAVPGNGTVPTFSVPVPASPQFFSFDFSYYGADLYPGCTVCASSTGTSLTISTSTNATLQAIIGSN